MSADALIDEDDYVSSEDSDFRPDDAEAAALESDGEDSDSDAELDKEAIPAKRKKDVTGDSVEDGDFDNSGDEALIEKAQRRQKKKKKKKGGDGGEGGEGEEEKEEEESGEGGIVKTRSMRAAERAEKKHAAAHGPVTIDVDAVWAQMKAGKVPPPQEDITASKSSDQPDATPDDTPAPKPAGLDQPDMVRIKRKYNFAGKVHTEEKLVSRDSAEAKLYLESAAPADEPSRAPPRKAFRSAFEPVLEPLQRRGDLNLGVRARLEAREAGAKKLNTVEKSRMDWAGFVDKEGLKEELEMAGRAKGSFAEREGFLARSEARREEDARRARVSAMG